LIESGCERIALQFSLDVRKETKQLNAPQRVVSLELPGQRERIDLLIVQIHNY